MMKIHNEKGFTLIEVVIALGVLAIGIIAMFSMQTMGIKGNSAANRITETTIWAADKVEEVVALGYADLVDTNKNGTKHDLNKDGRDDITGGNFGLNDTATGTNIDADETLRNKSNAPVTIDGVSYPPGAQIPTADGRYNVFWNVAEDHPIIGVKTVQVNVVNIRTNKSISLQYRKFDQI